MKNDDLFQRQPRPGMGANEAIAEPNESGEWEVRLRNYAADGSFKPVMRFVEKGRAESIAGKLNNVFTDHTADLDFITPGYVNGYYVVIWSGTTWLGKGTFTEVTESGDTYEDLYRGCRLPISGDVYYPYAKDDPTVLATVTNADIALANNRDPWEIALEWANNIRSCVNGWNCSEGATFGLIFDGKIYEMPVPKQSYNSTYTLKASYYGAGEEQPSVLSSDGYIFHTLDLTVAKPSLNDSGLSSNSWVRVSYNGKSIVARVTDQCGINRLDLSCGLAYALEFPGSGSVTISAP